MLVGVLALLLWSLVPHHRPLPPTASSLALAPKGVTMADYQALRVRNGRMTYQQVVALIGEGTLLSEKVENGTHQATYQWNGGGGGWGQLEATFTNGQLTSKRQFSLRKY